ncbi:ankyrin repeat-containing domain protein [Baffinella frigidus]|nr:ankyrin repeat-containing domain protein [Cryptophyta sp. CCMP2293]
MSAGEREGLHDTLATLGIEIHPEVLQSKGTSFNATKVLLAVSKANSRTVAALLSTKGISPHRTNYDGETPLHVAAFSGDLEGMKLLLGAGGHAAATDKNGFTPVDRAIQGGHGAVVELLLSSLRTEAASTGTLAAAGVFVSAATQALAAAADQAKWRQCGLDVAARVSL